MVFSGVVNWVLSKKIVVRELLERACVVTITLWAQSSLELILFLTEPFFPRWNAKDTGMLIC